MARGVPKKGFRQMNLDFKPGPKATKFDSKSISNRENQHKYYRRNVKRRLDEISDKELEKRLEEKFKRNGWD